MEGLVRHLFKQVLNVDLPDPLPRMTYPRRCAATARTSRIARAARASRRGDLVKGCDFKSLPAGGGSRGRVAALCVPQGGKLSRKEIDDYTAYVARYGAKGLAYVKVNETPRGATDCSRRS